MDILFICKQCSSYGDSNVCAYGLWNSANFLVNYLNSINISSSLVIAFDGSSIDALVFKNNPKVVIIEALWVTPTKLQQIISLPHHKGRTWIVRTHSEWPFISNEGIAVEWLVGYKSLKPSIYVATNTSDMSANFNTYLGLNSIYMPNIYYPNIAISKYKLNTILNKTIQIGCFGALRPLKNNLIQAVAAISIAKSLGCVVNFHINSTVVESDCNPTLKNIRALFAANPKHTLTEHPWESHTEFMKLVANMNLGLQMSFSETFNIVAADFVWNALPIVTSDAISWLPTIVQTNPIILEDIINSGLSIYNSSKRIVEESQTNLLSYNTSAQSQWKTILKQLGI